MSEPYFLRENEDDEGWSDHTSLIRASDGVEIAFDGGEPEDATFARDFSPVVVELNRVAALAKRAEAALSERRPVWLVIRADSADVMGAHDDELSALQDLTARNQHVSAFNPGYHIEKWLVQRSVAALKGDSE